MRTVQVKKDELLTALKKNREAHRSLFLAACDGYRTQVIKELESMLAEAKDRKRIRRTVELQEPVDQTAEYDRAIRMMEMEVRSTVEVSESEFSQYVLDQWGWSRQVLGLNSSYTGR